MAPTDEEQRSPLPDAAGRGALAGSPVEEPAGARPGAAVVSDGVRV
jgi:hypothetical protein